jgi:hypothetical protein
MKHPEDFVFHFTSAGAALSILTRRQLWATDIEYLNDRLEGQLPSKVLGWIVDKPENYLPGVQIIEKHLGALRKSLNQGLVACTISFSQHYRSLPQFRMYCPPAGGYAVGFPIDYLKEIGLFIKCDYSRNNLIEWSKAYAMRFLSDATALDSDDLDAVKLCQEIIRRKPYIQERVVAALTFKSEEFVNELEHRLVAFGLPKLFRESQDRNLIIPYSAIDLPNREIEVRLVPGPNREPDLASRSIGSLSRAAREAGTVWSMGHLSPGEFGFRA